MDLDFIGCEMLRTLPSSIGGLLQLQSLKMTNCVHVESLPKSFGQMRLLDKLNLEGARAWRYSRTRLDT